jgi:hypothetical protein
MLIILIFGALEFIVDVQFVTEVLAEWNLWGEWQNAYGKIREPMKIFYHHLKMNSAVKKIQNYGNKWIQHVWHMDKLPHLIIIYHPCGKRNQGHPPRRLPDC